MKVWFRLWEQVGNETPTWRQPRRGIFRGYAAQGEGGEEGYIIPVAIIEIEDGTLKAINLSQVCLKEEIPPSWKEK